MLCKVDRNVLEDGKIQAIKPDHRLVSFMAVIVPGPGWCEDNIAALHVNLFAFNCSETSLSFDDETQRKGTVAVRRCNFAGIDKLKTGIQCISGARCLYISSQFTWEQYCSKFLSFYL